MIMLGVPSASGVSVEHEAGAVTRGSDMTAVQQVPSQVDLELIQSAPDGVLLVDATGVITLANPVAGAILGLEAHQVVGRSVDEFVPVEVRDRHPQHRAGFLQHPVKRPMGSGLDLHALRSDGTKVPVEISLSPVVAEGNVQVLAIIRDVSERRRSEETIRTLTEHLTARVAHLEVLNAELESFSYSVSHDLRAPLRAIDGFSQALLEDYGQTLNADGRHYLDRVRAGAQRMAHLIDDLLVLSRISRADFAVSDVDVSDLASVVMRELATMEPQRRAEIDIEPGIVMRADHRQLRVILENLLGNAWKFTSQEPWTHISVSAAQLDGEAAFQVSDNGAGFDPEYADQLFEAFRRLHPDDEFPGSGIGLAIVNRIVRRHGGAIVAQSAPGRGATFTVRTTPATAAASAVDPH